jgi:methyl-accepting chemotaxis protein
MNIRVPIGYKFIIGFIIVVAVAAFVPGLVDETSVTEWLKKPLSFLVAIVIGLILGVAFTKGFTRRFSLISEATARISGGDLSDTEAMGQKGQIFPDETAELQESISIMSGSLRGLVLHMRDTVHKLSEAQAALSAVVEKGETTSEEVISGTAKIFDGALTQANHIGEAADTVKTMAGLADDVAKKATESANASQKVNSMVQRGAVTATSVMENMEGIFKGIEKTEEAAARLKEKINDIPKVLDVITHISRQTDLLALNAAIEASKAGEHGRGFAMVAEEVRRFADNTNLSVEDVSRIVKEVRSEVASVVAIASEGTASLKHGRDDLRKIREILVDITNYTSDVAERATSVIGITQDQKEKAKRTADIIEKVADIARENLSTTEDVDNSVERHGAAIKETIEASDKLKALSEEMKAVVQRFNI